MSDFELASPRKRGRSLLIVEGNHEKNELFRLVFKCFPELNVDFEDVWVYGTNIYRLYEEIVKEYGEDWIEVEVDLPFVLSRRMNYESARLEDFVNIFLVFDYEHHDSLFSEEKIKKLQKYFCDSTYVGKLYINYPMIESYQHIMNLDDEDYINRKVSVTVQPGACYKALVSKESFLEEYVDFPRKIFEILNDRFRVETQKAKRCTEKILEIDFRSELVEMLDAILTASVKEKERKTAVFQLNDLLERKGYLSENISYWTFMRRVLQKIIVWNILKGYKIQKEINDIVEEKCREYFETLNGVEILEKQNLLSRDTKNGYIWVLNMCILMVAEYRYELIVYEDK